MGSLHDFDAAHWDHEPTPNPSHEGNRPDADERLLPSWEGSGVGWFMQKTSGRGGEQGREVARSKFPFHAVLRVAEVHAMFFEQRFRLRFVVAEVAECFRVVQSELKRFGGVVEADQPNCAGHVARGAQHSQRV